MSSRPPISFVATPLATPDEERKTSIQITATTISDRENNDLDAEVLSRVVSREPVFRHHKAVTNIQLFYDLFIVANLTSFAEKQDVNSTSSLGSYIGYFCVLWFTWCQVSLYDVRFITDSIFERLAHAVHFGVIIALLVVAQGFQDLEEHPPWELLRMVTMVLIISRAALFFQYTTVLLFTWKFDNARMPSIVTMSTLFVSLMVYLGIYLVLDQSQYTYKSAFVGWYVMFAIEMASSIAVASHWHSWSFKGTHLVERMTTLSLVILGEGVISLSKVVVKILKLGGFTGGAIGGITCSILVIYLAFILYFDNVPTYHLGSVRQQLWAFLHFPFHVTLVLLCEGASQFIAWRRTIEYTSTAFSDVLFLSNPAEHAPIGEVYDALNTTIYTVLVEGPFTVPYEMLDAANQNLAMITGSNVTLTGFQAAVTNIQMILFKTVFDAYGFEPPDFAEHGVPTDVADVFFAYYDVFEFLFGYFFVCGGLTLILIAGLNCISMCETGQQRKWKMVGMMTNVVLGLSLCLLSFLTSTDAAFLLGSSTWTITVIVFVFLIAIAVDQISKRKMMAVKIVEE